MADPTRQEVELAQELLRLWDEGRGLSKSQLEIKTWDDATSHGRHFDRFINKTLGVSTSKKSKQSDREGELPPGPAGVATTPRPTSTTSWPPAVRTSRPHLTGNSYRNPARQIELRRQNCGSSHEAIYVWPASRCSPPTARPGESLHEQGLAIDFANCSTTSTACWRWLSTNATRFGLHPLPSEPWHLPSEPWHWSSSGQ